MYEKRTKLKPSNRFIRLEFAISQRKSEILFLISLHGKEDKLIITNINTFLSDLSTMIGIDLNKSAEFILQHHKEIDIEFDTLVSLLIKWESIQPISQKAIGEIEIAFSENKNKL